MSKSTSGKVLETALSHLQFTWNKLILCFCCFWVRIIIGGGDHSSCLVPVPSMCFSMPYSTLLQKWVSQYLHLAGSFETHLAVLLWATYNEHRPCTFNIFECILLAGFYIVYKVNIVSRTFFDCVTKEVWIPHSFSSPSSKKRNRSVSLPAKSTRPGLFDTSFFSHCVLISLSNRNICHC